MKDVIADVDRWVERGDDVALATVIDVKRSAPRPPGAKMAVNSRGEVSGAVSGGCVEGAVVAVAEEVGTAAGNQAVIASGDAGHLADALAAAGAAGGSGRPVLLVSRDSVPQATTQAMKDLGITSTVVVGGPSSVSDATLAQLPSSRGIRTT